MNNITTVELLKDLISLFFGKQSCFSLSIQIILSPLFIISIVILLIMILTIIFIDKLKK